MMAKTYPMLSSDGHLEVLPERWTSRMPAKYRALAPHTTTLPDGSDAIVMEGSGPFRVNYIDLRGGRKAEDWQPVGVKVENTPGIGPPEQRGEEQDVDGLLGMAVMPWTNIDDALAELAHAAEMGFKGVLLGVFPSGKVYPTAEDDRFWAAAQEMNMPVTIHVGFNRNGPRASEPMFLFPHADPEVLKSTRHIVDYVARWGMDAAKSMAPLILSGVF